MACVTERQANGELRPGHSCSRAQIDYDAHAAVLHVACLCSHDVFPLRRYVKFDTFHPAVEKGLPVTRVISRVVLQQILAEACTRVAGEGVILNDCRVVDYEETVGPSPCPMSTDNGQQWE